MRQSERRKSKRIVILCEGDTEVIAVKEFIRRQWEADELKEIGLDPIDLRGKIEDLFDKVPIYRKTDSKVVATFTLIDLYGLNQVKHKPDDDLELKVNRAKEWLKNGVGNSFEDYFYPHLSVHEIEAWFLAEGRCLAQRLKDTKLKPDTNAELKNFDKPPSKRVDELFRKHRGDIYQKINDGTPLLKCLDFKTVYDSCFYFHAFYDELVSVGRSALDNA